LIDVLLKVETGGADDSVFSAGNAITKQLSERPLDGPWCFPEYLPIEGT
jgi:hypothetical protein